MNQKFDNVFFVLTPIQLINAYEAKLSYCERKKNNLLVVFAEYSITLTQLKNLIKEQQWENIIFLFDEIKIKREGARNNIFKNTFRIFQNINNCRVLLRKLVKINNVFIGNIDNPYMYYMACRLTTNNYIILDEGNNTIHRMDRNSGKEPWYIGGPLSQNKKNLIFRYLARKRKIPKSKISFFSVFENLTIDTQIQYRQNDFSFTRKQFSLDEKENSNEVWFLGAPVISLGMIEKDIYFNLVLSIREYFKDFEFVYIRHRAEKETDLPPVNVKLFNYPVEYQLLVQEKLPQKVTSFHSGASINLYLLFKKIQVVNFILSDDILKSIQFSSGRQYIYKYYRKLECTQMVNLPLTELEINN